MPRNGRKERKGRKVREATFQHEGHEDLKGKSPNFRTFVS